MGYGEVADQLHPCGRLRIEALQLQGQGVGWAAKTMNVAAEYIEALEKDITEMARTSTNERGKPRMSLLVRPGIAILYPGDDGYEEAHDL